MAALSFTARFPYSGPQHDRQKLMRASLASSCLRGGMCVWQFMAGVRGAEVRRRPHEWRKPLLKSGVFHRVAGEPWLCGEELVRPMRPDDGFGSDYRALGDALRRGHTDMVGWCMGDQLPAFQHGMFHVRPIELDWLEAPLPTLMRSACAIGWDWGRRCIEQLVAESDDPVAVRMRKTGEYAEVFAMACAFAGSSTSLQWAEAFAADAGEERMLSEARVLSLVAGLSHTATCTLGVAEWLSRSYPDDVSTLVKDAAFNGNWSVMEWMLGTESFNLEFVGTYCFSYAARNDSVAAMRFLCDDGQAQFDEYASAAIPAARTGSLGVLEWLWSEKPACITRDCVKEAAGSGDVGKVRFLLERCGLEWTEEDAPIAAERGHVRVLEWAHEHGLATPQQLRRSHRHAVVPYPVLQFLLAHTPNLLCSVRDMARACRQDLRMVEALHARFPNVLVQDSEGSCLRNAAEAGRADVVEFILRHVEAPACTERTLAAVCATNHLELVQLLHGRSPDVALSSVAMQGACASGALEVVEWLHKEQGIAPDTESALDAGHLRVLEFFVQRCGISGPLDQAGLANLVCPSHVHVVEYLVRRGMVDDIGSLLQAAQKDDRKWPMQRFLRRHVAP